VPFEEIGLHYRGISPVNTSKQKIPLPTRTAL